MSRGRALVLFNAYSTMSAVRQRLEDLTVPYPVFTMSRNSSHIVEAFKKSGNGILLATGAAWEGFDFPGDMVSLLIIPRLPFAIPDAFSDYQKERLGSLKEFIRSVALPDMQIKLRQGFGRAIRLETDTCAVAILDERSLRGRRYHDAVRHALPDMPMTGNGTRKAALRKAVKRTMANFLNTMLKTTTRPSSQRSYISGYRLKLRAVSIEKKRPRIQANALRENTPRSTP